MYPVPFQAEHLGDINPQDAQVHDLSVVTFEAAKLLEGPLAWTFVDGDTVLACVGTTPISDKEALNWAVLSRDIRPMQFFKIHRSVLRTLERIEREGVFSVKSVIKADFEEGVRWAKLLGLKQSNVLGSGDLIEFRRG